MAYTEARGKGANAYYIARFSDGRGWPTVKDDAGRTLRFKRKRDALKAGGDKEAEVRGGQYHDPIAGKEKLGDWANAWFASSRVQELSARTVSNYQTALETIILPFFEETPLDAIDADVIGRWEAQLRADKYKPESIRTYRGVLSVCLADAVDAKKITANPVPKPRGRGKRAGKAKHRGAEKPVVSPFEALLLAERTAVLSERDDEFILLVTKAWTGARWGELVGLDRKYVRGETIRVEDQVEELDDGTFVWQPPKEDSRRDVDVPPFLAELLNRQRQIVRLERSPVCTCYREDKDTDPHIGGVWLFTGRTTRRRVGKNKSLKPVTAAHWRRSGFESMIFKPAAEGFFPPKAPLLRRPVPVTADPFPGLPLRGRNYVERSAACWVPIRPGLTPHLLRHSHRTWCSEAHIPEVLIHERLGHELTGMAGRYTRPTDGMRKELIEALTEMWLKALDERLRLAPGSPVAILDELLTARTKAKKKDDPGLPTKVVPQNSHRGRVSTLRSRPRKSA